MTAEKTDKDLEQDARELEEALDVICGALQPGAEALASATGRTVLSCITTLLRPMLANYLATGHPINLAKEQDNRTRQWSVKLYIYNLTLSEDVPDLEFESEVELVRGLPAVGEVIRETVADHHDLDSPEELAPFTSLRMAKRMGGMYPAVVRGNGKAITRIPYVLDGQSYLCLVEVSRV